MILQFAIAAQGVAVDRYSNRLSIFNVVEQIVAPKFPILIPELAFIVVLIRQPEEPAVFDTVLTMHVGEATVGRANLHIDFERGMGNRQITNFQNLPIFGPGDLRFSFNLPNGDSVNAVVPVLLTPETPPQATPQAEVSR